MPRWTLSPIERFWTKVRREPSCWIWTASLNPKGYGHFYWDKRVQSSHRVSWLIHNGEIPNGMHVLHKCDVRNCVNPNHLFLGTHQENIKDMINKTRKKIWYGEESNLSFFTAGQVLEIRSLAGKLTQAEIAELFNCTKSAIKHILKRRSWKHI